MIRVRLVYEDDCDDDDDDDDQVVKMKVFKLN